MAEKPFLEFSKDQDGVHVVRLTDEGRTFVEDQAAGRIVLDPFDVALESCIRKGLMRRVDEDGIEITELGRQIADAALEEESDD